MAKKAKPKPKAYTPRKPRGEIPAPIPEVYEYDYIELSATISKDEIIKSLNDMGDKGWRFMEITEQGGLYRIWFVREK